MVLCRFQKSSFPSIKKTLKYEVNFSISRPFSILLLLVFFSCPFPNKTPQQTQQKTTSKLLPLILSALYPSLRSATSSYHHTAKRKMATSTNSKIASEMADDFNSSDIEFEPAPALYPNAGRASIELMIRNAESDRITSQRAVEQLRFGHGAPATRTIQSLWVTRFNAFREQILNQSLKVPFTENDLLRFLSAIVCKHISSFP